MRFRWMKWLLFLALALPPRLAAAQCMGGGGAGEHQHGEKSTAKGEKKARQQIDRLLAEERSRALLLETILADGDFMRLLVARIAETPEWRALAAERLSARPLVGSPTRADSAAANGPARPTESEAALYSCPMHPEVTSRDPGKCPKCGMALERTN